MRHLERLARADRDDTHPYKVGIVGTSAVGDVFTVVYRQAVSPQLLGRRGVVTDLGALFEPGQTMDQLAGILLQDMSEPSGSGGPGPTDWAVGVVPDPKAVGWIGVGA